MTELLSGIFEGEAKYAILIYVAIFTFLIALVLFMIISVIYSLRREQYMRKNHSTIWQKGKVANSIKGQIAAMKELRAIDDPILKGLGDKQNKYGKLCFIIWLFLCLGVGVFVLILRVAGK